MKKQTQDVLMEEEKIVFTDKVFLLTEYIVLIILYEFSLIKQNTVLAHKAMRERGEVEMVDKEEQNRLIFEAQRDVQELVEKNTELRSELLSRKQEFQRMEARVKKQVQRVGTKVQKRTFEDVS